MRLFVAAPVPEGPRREAAALQRRLAAVTAARVTWVAEHNLHLTVQFLGEVGEAGERRVRRALARSVEELAPFDASLGALGAFPRWEEARVVFLSLARGEADFVRLVRRVGASLEELGFAPERRRVQAHLTLGRVREGRLPAPSPVEASAPFRVEHLILFASRLTPRGPIYEVRERFALRGSGKDSVSTTSKSDPKRGEQGSGE